MSTNRPRFCARWLVVAAMGCGSVGCSATDDSAAEDTATATQALHGSRHEPSVCTGEVRHRPLPRHERRNVILVVADGRQLEDEIAISRYLHGRDHHLHSDRLPYQGFVATWDVTSYNAYAAANGKPAYDASSYDPLVGYDPVLAGNEPYPQEDPDTLFAYLTTYISPRNGWWAATDSASAATAMSTGKKTDDGNIAWLPGDPSDGALPSVGEQARAARGMSFGVVSTQPISAATPAAFSAHNPSRSNATAIANEIVNTTQPDVVIGGGHPTWKAGSISTADYDALKTSETYLLVERSVGVPGGPAILAGAEQAIEQNKKLFGLFGAKSGSFDFGVPADAPGNPSVEFVAENPTLADASEAALRVLSRNRAGFFLMIEQGDIDTANHANNFANMIACGVDLEQAVDRVIDFVNRPHDDISWANTVLLVVADHSTGYMRFNPEVNLGKGDLPLQSCTTAGCTYPDGEVSYGTKGHSNELVHLSAAGHMAKALTACEGNEYPGTRIINNTALHSFMLHAAGL